MSKQTAAEPARRRRARGSLTRAEIAGTALGLLDEHGPEAVTVRQIARALDVAVMSLYVHVTNKQEIIDAAADLVLADLPLADGSLSPREAVTSFYTGLHDKLREHPGVARAIATSPLLGPATFESMDSLFAVLATAQLTTAAAVAALTELTSYTVGFTLFSIARDQMPDDVRRRRRAAFLAVDPETLPHLHRARDSVLPGPSDEQFLNGLSRLVESLIPSAP
jgi:AcrR family transcriptional regulator